MARNLRNLVPGSVVLLVGAAIGFLIGIAIETLIVFLLTAPPFVAFLERVRDLRRTGTTDAA